jgi:predicted phosphodiesterase
VAYLTVGFFIVPPNSPIMTKADLARQFRVKYGSEMPSLQLARIMFKQKKRTFKDVEEARSVLRYIENKGGQKCKKVIESEFAMSKPRPYNPYKIPESDETSFDPLVIKGPLRIGVIGDVHAPYHSIAALTAAISSLKKAKIELLVIAGDLWDFYGLSRFLKDPEKRRFSEELNIGIQIMEMLQKELKCKIIFKPGNHDDRLMHYIWQKMGEIEQLADLEEIKQLSLESMVRKRSPKLDIEFAKTKQIVKANDLNIVHGHEFASSIMSPVNIARGLYLRAKASTICFHHHRSSEHTEMSINGKITTCWSVGSLCELHPEYMPINSWNHGFAIIDLFEDGETFEVQNKRIFQGKIL